MKKSFSTGWRKTWSTHLLSFRFLKYFSIDALRFSTKLHSFKAGPSLRPMYLTMLLLLSRRKARPSISYENNILKDSPYQDAFTLDGTRSEAWQPSRVIANVSCSKIIGQPFNNNFVQVNLSTCSRSLRPVETFRKLSMTINFGCFVPSANESSSLNFFCDIKPGSHSKGLLQSMVHWQRYRYSRSKKSQWSRLEIQKYFSSTTTFKILLSDRSNKMLGKPSLSSWLLNWRTVVNIRTTRMLSSNFHTFSNLLWGYEKGLLEVETHLIQSEGWTWSKLWWRPFFGLQSNPGTKPVPNRGEDFFWTGPNEFSSLVSGHMLKLVEYPWSILSKLWNNRVS